MGATMWPWVRRPGSARRPARTSLPGCAPAPRRAPRPGGAPRPAGAPSRARGRGGLNADGWGRGGRARVALLGQRRRPGAAAERGEDIPGLPGRQRRGSRIRLERLGMLRRDGEGRRRRTAVLEQGGPGGLGRFQSRSCGNASRLATATFPGCLRVCAVVRPAARSRHGFASRVKFCHKWTVGSCHPALEGRRSLP